MVGFLLISSG